jgi:Fur family ferric uptake transcriptional regulator
MTGISPIERVCADKGLRMTAQRRLVARVLSASQDHPNIEELHRRARKINSHIALSTVYRIVHAFCGFGIVEKHNFASGRTRLEVTRKARHAHLIDIRSGTVVDFRSDEIEDLLSEIANHLGYRMVEHRLELYGVPIDGDRGKIPKRRHG